MKDFRKELYRHFGRNPHFNGYAAFIDKDGNYASFGAFGDLLRDILLEKIDDHALLVKQCSFIDEIAAVNDAEWNNVLKSEVFSILNNTELIKLEAMLSEESNRLLRIYLPASKID